MSDADREAMRIAVRRKLPLIIGIDLGLLGAGLGVYFLTGQWLWVAVVIAVGTAFAFVYVARQIAAAREDARKDIVQ